MSRRFGFWISDEEYMKLRKMAYEDKKSMGAVIRERLGFLSEMEDTMAALNEAAGIHEAHLGIVPKTATEANLLHRHEHKK